MGNQSQPWPDIHNTRDKVPYLCQGVQILNVLLAALNWFLSRSTHKCKTFFHAIKKNGTDFCWDEQYEAACQSLKAYLVSPPLLSKPLPNETFFLYLTIFDTAVSTVLVQEDEAVQKPIYYISKSLINAQMRTPFENHSREFKGHRKNSEVGHRDQTPRIHIRAEVDSNQRISFSGLHCRIHIRTLTAKQPLERVNPERG